MWKQEFKKLLELGQIHDPLLGKYIHIMGSDPIVNSPFHLGEGAAIALAAFGAAVSSLWRLRTSRHQYVQINVEDAALSLKSVQFLRLNGYPVPLPDIDYPTIDFYQTRDKKFIMLHGGYPRLRDGLLRLLNCANDRKAIAAAVQRYKGEELEKIITKERLCGGLVRHLEEWEAHPQGKNLIQQPLIKIQRIAEGVPQRLPLALRPLSGIRVLDLTHVLAGPIASRTIAEQGAEVLCVRGPQNPSIPAFVMDTSHGKFSSLLDIKSTNGFKQLENLIREADILVESYRPGALKKIGITPDKLAALKPTGIIYVSISCYGNPGPLSLCPGWEQIAQAVTGMAVTQGSADSPQLSCVYPNDYITGYLAAYGALAALLLRSTVGGSYAVSVSLCKTAMWLQSLGRVNIPEPLPEHTFSPTLTRLLLEQETTYGHLTYLGPVTQFSETPSYWSTPTTPLGSHSATWKPRLPYPF